MARRMKCVRCLYFLILGAFVVFASNAPAKADLEAPIEINGSLDDGASQRIAPTLKSLRVDVGNVHTFEVYGAALFRIEAKDYCFDLYCLTLVFSTRTDAFLTSAFLPKSFRATSSGPIFFEGTRTLTFERRQYLVLGSDFAAVLSFGR